MSTETGEKRGISPVYPTRLYCLELCCVGSSQHGRRSCTSGVTSRHSNYVLAHSCSVQCPLSFRDQLLDFSAMAFACVGLSLRQCLIILVLLEILYFVYFWLPATVLNVHKKRKFRNSRTPNSSILVLYWTSVLAMYPMSTKSLLSGLFCTWGRTVL